MRPNGYGQYIKFIPKIQRQLDRVIWIPTYWKKLLFDLLWKQLPPTLRQSVPLNYAAPYGAREEYYLNRKDFGTLQASARRTHGRGGLVYQQYG
jgi:hypothetical protein